MILLEYFLSGGKVALPNKTSVIQSSYIKGRCIMKHDRLQDILAKVAHSRIGVIGDFCLDAYWSLAPGERELSVETGKPTHAVTSQKYALGGAANVVANLSALGVGSVKAFAIVGDDIFGREIVNQLDGLGVDTQGVVTQKERWDTAVYAKPYQGNDEQERLDYGRFNHVSVESEQAVLVHLARSIKSLDVLIVNQQLSSGGIISPPFIEHLNILAAQNPACTFLVDSRDLCMLFRGMILKLNAVEAAGFCGQLRAVNRAIALEDVEQYMHRINHTTHKPVFVTRGRRGLAVYDGATTHLEPGVHILKKTDPVGAGDTIASALAASLSAGASLAEAATFGNLAAAVTVQKLKQTGTASPEELLAIGTDTDYVFRPETAEDIRCANYLDASRIEIINPDIERGQIQHVLFDHDGTISTLRQGWESIMEPMMVRAILGDRYDHVSEEDWHRVLERVREVIDKSTGVQTIVQMQTLVELVAEFGFVSAGEIHDPMGYKTIYNDALMQLIHSRRQCLAVGELDTGDYTLKGAVDFLKSLRECGLTLYLASGTDEADVREEAAALGYADLFNGGIFGSVGDIAKYSKKMVIERIITENNLRGGQLACFGDGPVELRETRKRGGIAVGLASDEIQRYGLNPEKRARLIMAGADLIIPDFSQRKKLFDYLWG